MEKQEFVFPKKVSQEKTKSNSKDLKTSNRFSVLARENASDLQWLSLAIDLDEQSCSRKDTTPLRESSNTPNNDKKSDEPIKIYRKEIAIVAKKSVVKRRWKIKNLDSLGMSQ